MSKTKGAPAEPGEIAQIARQLRDQLESVPAIFRGRTDDILDHHASPDDWCAKQVLGHLIEAEGEVFTQLIPGMIGREMAGGWDKVPDMVRDECRRPIGPLLERWTRLRRAGIELAESLRDEDLMATSERNWHAGPEETVGDLYRHWPEHTEIHADQAAKAISAAGG